MYKGSHKKGYFFLVTRPLIEKKIFFGSSRKRYPKINVDTKLGGAKCKPKCASDAHRSALKMRRGFNRLKCAFFYYTVI